MLVSHVLRVRRTMPVMMPLDLIRRVMSRPVLRTNVSRTMLVSHVLRVRRTLPVMMPLDLIRRVMSRPVLNERVSNNTCVACAAGTTNDAGDDASGSNDITTCALNTTCDVTTGDVLGSNTT